MRNAFCAATLLAAHSVASPPVVAASAPDCAPSLRPYNVTGIVKSVGASPNGQIYYSVPTTRDLRCGSPKHYTIGVLPGAAVASCNASRRVRASGTFDYGCIEDANGGSGFCGAELGFQQDATLTCR